MRTLGIWIILTILSLSFALRNPYEILGVKSSATITEIKKAYKRLAKEWHPDKNSDSSAPTKFVEITQAYEVLSDPERRALYDSQGITEDVSNSRDRHDHGHFGHFEKFDSFFSRGGFKFEFNFDQSRSFSKQTITSKVYVNSVVPTSAWQPYLILFYSDWCIACLQAEAIWNKISEELEPLGLGIATIHAERDRGLAKKIGVTSLPYLILTLDGHPYHYKETQLSFVRVVEFVKKKFPYQMVVTLDIDSTDNFLDGWMDNRVRVLIFSPRESIRLRYLLVAYWFLSRAAFGYVHLEREEGRKLAEKYHVPTNMETLLLFKEDKMMPAATLSMPDMSSTAMKDVINDNKYLILPRLSSQEIFDQLCPPESSLARKRLCVVLVTQDIPAHEPYRQALRDYLREHPLKNDRARFMYIFADKQKDFLTALTTEDAGLKDIGLVVLWRRNEKTVQYRWLKDGWSMNLERVNISGDVLHTTVITLLHSKDSLSPDAIIKALVDEHVVNIFSRMILKLVTITQCLKDSITRNEILPAVTVLLTIGFIVLGGYFMAYLVKLEEQTIAEKYQREGKDIPGVTKKMIKETPFKVHELRGETYNGLVKLLKPGCRTIVILVDNESKAKLYPIFYRTCFPYRRNKTLMFAFLLLEKNLEWYRRLLIQTLAEPRELNINPKNCIGTVLSLNGHRKYFCMYHAKYRENFRPGAIKKELKGGDFMGFQDTSDSEGETSDIEVGPKMEKLNLIEQRPDDNLLEGFPYWLDRLFEGLTQRYYLQFWPSMK